MSDSLSDIKREALERRKAELVEEYKAASEALGRVSDEVRSIHIERQVKQLEKKIEELEEQIQQLDIGPDKVYYSPDRPARRSELEQRLVIQRIRYIAIGLGTLIVISVFLFLLSSWLGENKDKYGKPTKEPPPELNVSPFEENDSQDQAYGPLIPGYLYIAPPDDPEDWYFFVLSQTSSISVKITNYSAIGQLVIYVDNPDSNPPRQILANDGRGKTLMEIPNELLPNALDDLSPGRYFVRVYSTDKFNAIQNYHLIITISRTHPIFRGTLSNLRLP
jgi:hypothetical protein